MRRPSSHTTMHTVPYTAVHVALGFMVPNGRRPTSAQPYLAGSARYLGLRPSCEASAQGGRKSGPASVDMFSPSPVGPATTASADFCRPIPTPCDAGSNT